MAQYDQLTELLDLPNMRVTHYQRVGPERLNVFIESTFEAAVCPVCEQVSVAVHDRGEAQFIRDLPIWNRRCWLRYAPRRFECAQCGNTFVERVAWREAGRDYTARYEQYIYERARHEPTRQIARAERLSDDIVHGIFQRGAKKHLPSAAPHM